MILQNFVAIFALGLGVSCAIIYRNPAASIEEISGWIFLGCCTDNVSARTLLHSESLSGGSGAMTNEACQTACLASGFTLAGTEYSGECWCDNYFHNGGGLALDGSSGCNMKCNGNSAETCGGPNRLDTYQYTSSTSPGKRGLAYNNNNSLGDATLANLFVGYSKISWGYDWGYPSLGLESTIEFVPMLWGLPNGADLSWTSAVQSPGTENILGFNEPDLTYSGSANILPAVAAAGYTIYMEPFSGAVKIGTPNVLWNNVGSSSGGPYDSAQWLSYFFGNCSGCHFDFAAIHYYQDCQPSDGQSGAAWFQGNVTDAYNVLGLPVWITEFQCYGTEAQQITFLQQVLPWLDAQPYVKRYAYFGVFPDYLVDDAGNGLSDLGVTYATT